MKDTRKRLRLETGKPSEQETNFRSRLDVRIVGQEGGKAAATRAYRRFLNPLRDRRRPIYVAYLLGDKGSGKTLTAETCAELIHGDSTAFIKVNCSNYKEKHRVSQLLGAPPSYVGYKDPTDAKDQPKPGQIDTSAKLSMHNKVASRKGSPVPVTVVLLDEAEKMVEELEDVFLSIFDKGEVDFGNNTVGDYTDCIFFLAGNVGSEQLRRLKRRMGFHISDEVSSEDVTSTVWKVLEDRYKPEFLDRIDEVVVYQALTAAEKRAVVDSEILKLEERIMSQLPRGLQFTLEIDKKAREFVLAEALKGDGSARKIKRTLSQLVEEPLGNELIKHTISLGDVVEVTHEKGKGGLSFFLVEGAGEVSEADRLPVHGDTPATLKGLAFQRKLDRAQHKAAWADKAQFEVVLSAESKA
ncbi:MAG TPA: AAA family ATPase, partial [Candidatus Obscuribacterales bacterium]